MSLKLFKILFFIILISSILFFYTRNINIFNNKFYKNIKIIQDQNNILVLVNKNNKLSNTFVPSNLEKIDTAYSYQDKYLKKEALDQFKKLYYEALKNDYKITIVSAYRTYEYQQKLFSNYKIEKGKKYALKCSAKAGHSEHQTGLAVDIMGSNSDYNKFDKSKEFNWMKENAHHYGFILRYPKGKEKITGFKYEPWHYRYVGIFAANIIYNENITLEEYYELYLKNS